MMFYRLTGATAHQGAPAADQIETAPPDNSARPRDRIIALVDMNAFFAQIEQICNPALRGKPVVVGGSPGKRSVVTAASYEARPYGIKAGMSYYEALQKCPHAVMVVGDNSKYLDYCHRIVAIFREFTDQVEPFSIDEAFLDLTGVLHLHKSPEAIGHTIKRTIRDRLGLQCSVGIGPNKLVAKMAADWQKPDGLSRVWPEELPHILYPFPVEELIGVGRKMKNHLNRLGIYTIGDLARTPTEILDEKFGIYGSLLHRWANGIDETPVDPGAFLTVKSMGHSYTLPADTDNPETIKWFIFWLSDKVARRLRHDSYAGRTITLSVRSSAFDTFSRAETILLPTASTHEISATALSLFHHHSPPGLKVRLLGVSVSNLRKITPSQLDLYDTSLKKMRLLETLDAVKDKYGDSSLTYAVLADNHRKMLRPKVGVFLTNKEKGHSGSPPGSV